jgi:hypothetical protein
MLTQFKSYLARRDADPLYNDMLEEGPFWAIRAGENRFERVNKMLQMGFISRAEAMAMLGAT